MKQSKKTLSILIMLMMVVTTLAPTWAFGTESTGDDNGVSVQQETTAEGSAGTQQSPDATKSQPAQQLQKSSAAQSDAAQKEQTSEAVTGHFAEITAEGIGTDKTEDVPYLEAGIVKLQKDKTVSVKKDKLDKTDKKTYQAKQNLNDTKEIGYSEGNAYGITLKNYYDAKGSARDAYQLDYIDLNGYKIKIADVEAAKDQNFQVAHGKISGFDGDADVFVDPENGRDLTVAFSGDVEFSKDLKVSFEFADPAKAAADASAKSDAAADSADKVQAAEARTAAVQMVALLAANDDHTNKIHVIVENTTFKKADGAAWDGTLVDTWVDYSKTSTMMSCVKDALKTVDATQTGADSGYISEINGLKEYDGGLQSGWTGTLNDWFTDAGFGDYTAANGKLEAGDEIRIMYTCSWGADVGNDWSSTDTGLSGIKLSAGTLNPVFSKDIKAYTLLVSKDISQVNIVPTAVNKAFQTRIFVDGKQVKRTESADVKAGSKIKIICDKGAFGDKASQTTDAASIYEITVKNPVELDTIRCKDATMIDGKIVAKKGDVLQFEAVDESGRVQDVTWSTSSSWIGSLDSETGAFTVSNASQGGSSYLYLTATTKNGSGLKKEAKFEITGYEFSDYNRKKEVTLSSDGQSDAKVSVTGGVSGHTVWEYDKSTVEKIAELTADPGNGTSIGFKALRPGSFTVSFKLDVNEQMTDTAMVNIRGVAVEDKKGNNKKTYLEVSGSEAHPTAQLEAFAEAGKTIESWSSSDDSIVTVDADGKITAQGIGSAIVKATDSAGQTGGIKVVVKSKDIPYFESLEFLTSAFTSGTWVKDQTFQPTKLSYDLPLKQYSVSTLTLQNTTEYDTTKYTAKAFYTDANGDAQEVTVNSGAITKLENIPFDDSTVKIVVFDKNLATNKTEYEFHVTRPRDTTKLIRNAIWTTPAGLILSPVGRELASSKYNGEVEGTFFRTDENGVAGTATGVQNTVYFYRTYLLNGTEKFKLDVAASTNYAHVRYSSDDGNTWNELKQGGSVTKAIAFPAAEAGKNAETKVRIQILDDATYTANVKAGRDGFAEGTPTEYIVWVEQIQANAEAAQILTAKASIDGGKTGDWYPEFSPNRYGYNIVVPNGVSKGTLKYTVAEGASVVVDKTEQTPTDESGTKVYSLDLTTSQKTITVTSADGTISNDYKFKLQPRPKYNTPDKVVDYLCIGSQYSNGAQFGALPEATLSGSLKSLGNFGGYITYYYDNPLTDNPNNLYGIDFYVYGNSSEQNQASMAEPGQVYVSENGTDWYALAGSEHYEDKTIWDYTITYKKGDDGKAYWTDNQGNSMKNNGTSWPTDTNYYLNGVAGEESYTYTGILLKSSEDNTIMGTGSTSSFSAATKFGYADYYANGTIGADVNPYVENPTKSNGFDLAWAVDSKGNPVDVSNMKFHYVKVATASNIWAGAFNEKSTEVASVVRTAAQAQAVGTTAAPESITLAEGDDSRTVALKEGQQIYTIGAGDRKKVTLTVNGTAEDDNIYINNQRVKSGEASSEFTVPQTGEKLVRVIVQNGEKNPQIYLLKIVAGMTADDKIQEVKDLIDSIGDVTLDKEAGIKAAREAYDALDDALKAQIDNFEVLTAAEAKLEKLKNASVEDRIGDYYETTGKYLMKAAEKTAPTVSSTGGEWLVLGLARAEYGGTDSMNQKYLQNVKKVLEDNKGVLSTSKYTEYSRVILGLTSIGVDVNNVAGYNLLEGLADFDNVIQQGVNGPIYALLALDSHDYQIPDVKGVTNKTTRDKLIEYILDQQLKDGGWSLSGSSMDVDMTAAAIQALAPYYNSNAKVKQAVDTALEKLSQAQNKNGGFESWGVENCESCAQVIVALTSLGIDPDKDARFVKNGKASIDALLEYGLDGGGFKHTKSGELNGMATEQAYYALAAYSRFIKGNTALFDMSDVTIKESPDKANENTGDDKKDNKDPNKTAVAPSGSSLTASGTTRSITKKATIKLGKMTEAAKAVKGKLDVVVNAKLPQNAKEYTDDQIKQILDAYKAYNALSVSEKKAIEATDTWTAFTEITQNLGSMYHYDESTGIDVRATSAENLPWYIKLVATPKTASEKQKTKVQDALGDNSELFTLYDIHFINTLDNSEWHPSGLIRVKMPMVSIGDYKTSVIVHIADSGKIRLIEGHVDSAGGTIEFEASDFSLYGIAGSDQSIDSLLGAQAARDVMPWIIAGAIAAAILIAIIVMRKRRNKREFYE